MQLVVRDVHKSYDNGAERVEVLRGVSFQMDRGEAMAITGPSGAGKSTLLHMIGTLDTPTSGTIEIEGVSAAGMAEAELAAFRNARVGFVFQDPYLLPQYSVRENVLVPTMAYGGSKLAPARAEELLERVGLSHRLTHRPDQLSGGERQRVSVARALINAPSILLCDEPTGSLDEETAATVVDLLFEMHQQENTVMIVVTHDLRLADRFGRRCDLRGGRCSEP